MRGRLLILYHKPQSGTFRQYAPLHPFLSHPHRQPCGREFLLFYCYLNRSPVFARLLSRLRILCVLYAGRRFFTDCLTVRAWRAGLFLSCYLQAGPYLPCCFFTVVYSLQPWPVFLRYLPLFKRLSPLFATSLVAKASLPYLALV